MIGPESLTYASSRSKISKILRLTDFRESAQPEYPGADLSTWEDVFREFPTERLGLAGFHMFPHAIYSNMTAALGQGEVIDADYIVREVMLIKSPAEIACLRESARISEIGFKAVVENIKPGMTEVQVVAIATAAMLDSGLKPLDIPFGAAVVPILYRPSAVRVFDRFKRVKLSTFKLARKYQDTAPVLLVLSCWANVPRRLEILCSWAVMLRI